MSKHRCASGVEQPIPEGGIVANATPGPRNSNIDFRRTRHIKRNVKLHHQLRDLIAANAECRYIGGNAAVEHVATRLGFEPHDLAIIDVKIGRRIVTLIAVPHRIWDRAFPSAKAIDLRFQSREAGHAAILVPQAVVEREPRLSNSQLVARTASIKVDATARMIVLAHLIENGACCLSELAGHLLPARPGRPGSFHSVAGASFPSVAI